VLDVGLASVFRGTLFCFAAAAVSVSEVTSRAAVSVSEVTSRAAVKKIINKSAEGRPARAIPDSVGKIAGLVSLLRAQEAVQAKQGSQTRLVAHNLDVQQVSGNSKLSTRVQEV
jgi:hypothetical protein